jgi:hypothetical protein
MALALAPVAAYAAKARAGLAKRLASERAEK